MADNITLPGTGIVVATNEVASEQFQYVKVVFGADGVATKVDATNALPVTEATRDIRFITYEDTSFVTGDSPVTLDINTDLSRDGRSFSVINDGAGNFTVAVSNDGTTYSTEKTMKTGETFAIAGLTVDSIRITWVADSSYRVLVY